MKKQIILSALFLLAFLSHAVAQNWQWANSAGGANNDRPAFICQDANGNLYVTGGVQYPVAYFQTDTFNVSGFNDIYLAKYDANGNELWVKHFGGSYFNSTNQKSEGGSSVVFNPNTNSIYLSGVFIGTCTIDTITLLTAPSDIQIFLAKFDLNGNCLWAKSAGSGGDEGVVTMAISSSNSIYLSGTVKYNATFDTIHTGNGGYLAMYSESGNCQWAKIIYNGVLNNFYGSTVSPYSIQLYNGDLFIIGYKASDSAYVDTILITNTSNYHPLVLARFDSIGNVKWAKQMGGPFPEFAILSMDNNGNCYLGSKFFGGYVVVDSDTVYAMGTTDFFFTKYDQNGNFKWVRQGNATLNARAIGTSSDAEGNVYLTGSFSGNATFGTFNVTANTTEDMFIARYDSIGNCIGVRHAGQGTGWRTLIGSNVSCIIAGYFKNSLALGATTLTSQGNDDFFIAKTDAITGVGELFRMANNKLVIYANPNEGRCTITIPDEFLNERNLTLHIYDISGKLIQQKTLTMNEGKIKLSLEEQAKGIYNVTLDNGEKAYYGRIIFE
jgi:hypothetical protein